jgi:hypothetical protein
VAGFSWSYTALAALMMSSSLLYKLKRAECLLCNQMQTYSVDFFLTAFFTRKARRGVLVVGGGVSPACGVAPTTVTVTATVADGADPTPSVSVLGGEAEGLQMDIVSLQQYRCLAIQQGSKTILEDSTTCAFRLRTTRRPCGTKGRASVNSTAGLGELSRLAPPSASFSAWGLSSSMDSLLCRAAATRAFFASAAALGRRWSGRGMSCCGGELRYNSICPCKRFSVSSGITKVVPTESSQILWQNRLNYSGSSALMIAAQLQSAQCTSNGTIPWSVGSPPDTTTVQQDRSRFTSHEGEFTSQNSSSTFNLQPYIHYYKPSSNISKFIQTMFKLTSITACPNSQRKGKNFTRLHTSRRRTPSLAQGLVSLRRVTASWGRVPLHGPAKRNGRWPHKVVRGILEGHI